MIRAFLNDSARVAKSPIYDIALGMGIMAIQKIIIRQLFAMMNRLINSYYCLVSIMGHEAVYPQSQFAYQLSNPPDRIQPRCNSNNFLL